MAAVNSTPTDSEALVKDFLDSNPQLASDLGEIQVMTDRYTNQEWERQIRETQKKVVVNEGEKGARRYLAPAVGSREFAETVDHTLLKLDATTKQIDALCAEARTEGFKSVCVRLNHVSRCISNLKGTSVVVACVVGFHEGIQDTYSKLLEARAAVAAGASELDIVLNHSILTANSSTPTSSPPPQQQPQTLHKRDSTADTITWRNTEANSKPTNGSQPASGPYSVSAPGSSTSARSSSSRTETGDHVPETDISDYSAIYRELASLRSLCPAPTTLKLILETSQLSSPQILAAAHLAAAANFDFIKTSTGFNGPGATLPDVQLMVAAAEYLSTRTKSNAGSPVRAGGGRMQVKASGGIRSLEDAVRMLEAGASRLGTSSGLWIMQEARARVEEGQTRRPSPVSRLYTDDSVEDY
ncbi:aldolase [Lophiostoma macrostomum CBS 122681]|uniref:deoxyribose-phosphate aldolase n=1 Tax=Lophiostoma macrostomum CBS 122681 TaxID=1314788 RepID=A0A6A6SYD7_9PLEO|nr:aldolase [Lophiostoma macrostomum CBS 122681]